MRHITDFLHICNDLAVAYSALITQCTEAASPAKESAKPDKPETTELAYRLLNTICTFIQRGQVQRNASTFKEAGQLLVISGNLICDILQRFGSKSFPQETHAAARMIMSILVTTPGLQDQIEARQTVEFCRKFWQETRSDEGIQNEVY